MSAIIICPTCNGRGQVVANVVSERNYGGISYACCPRCHGHGQVPPRVGEDRSAVQWFLRQTPEGRLAALADMRALFCFACGHQACSCADRSTPATDPKK